MNHPKIEVKMFGDFSFRIDGENISKESSKLSKIWETFIILSMTKDNPISNELLMDHLWRGDMSTNPQNALKNVIYCLRRDICDGRNIDPSIITYSCGKYTLSPNIEIVTDAHLLVQTYKKTQQNNLSNDELAKAYKEIMTLYSTGFILKSSVYPYALPWVTYFKNIFNTSCSKLCELMMSQSAYTDVLDLSTHAIKVNQFNQEFYLYNLKALEKLKRYNTIIHEFHQISRFFLVEQGIELSGGFKDIYDNACVQINPEEQEIILIRAELRANISNTDSVKKAYFCSYEVFKHMCDLKIRDASRNRKETALILLSVTDQNTQPLSNDVLSDVMDDVRVVIGSSLRKGDIFAKYSKSQFVILMTTDSIQQLQKVVSTRINSNISNELQRKNIKLSSLVIAV